MNGVKEFLKDAYRKRSLGAHKGCPPMEVLCDYADGRLSPDRRKKIESHLARCYHCLDIVVSMYDGDKYIYKRRRRGLKKEDIFLIIAIISFLSSFIFSRYFLQFLTATFILGVKWIVDTRSTKTLIMIYEAYKRGGEREAMKVLKDFDIKGREDF